MVAISRVQAVFTGGAVVGPAAASVFTTGDVINLRGPWIDFWNAIKMALPPSLTVTIPNTGETYDDATGDLTEVWTSGTNTVVQSTQGTQSFAKGVGARVVWQTNGLTNGRRVRGSTYIVPLTSVGFDATGTIDSVVLGWLFTASEAFVAATQSDFTIWTRPKPGVPGKSSGVTGSAVPDKVSTLRSRRV